nr:A24 family peptidase [Silicimonas algicola]
MGAAELDASLGAATGFALFAILGAAYHRRFGVEGLGGGDAKLLAAAGAWLGWQPLPFVVLIASAGTLAVVLLSRSKRRDIAFGPGLALAFALVWLAFLST